jgi:succinate dehydrogenase/fumarate reductase flavoprotein subunit
VHKASFHTLVIGSGAAGLACACRLHEGGIESVALLTEGLHCGTSINTGSDKQTYYKLGLSGETPDSPVFLARTLFEGGSADGDLAFVEAACSARAFLKLVELGVPFPRDRYGSYPGYRTDHDPVGRATSTGPYTSQAMCRAWQTELRRRQLQVLEGRRVVSLLVQEGRVLGARAWNEAEQSWEVYAAQNVVYAVGGPGALYRSSVYPQLQTGGIGPALRAGALAQSLPESQFGMASTKFRWNVSGSYMQVVPRMISRAADGLSDEREFLRDYLPDPGELYSLLFLKGYQWPFDVSRARSGSSQIDLWVYEETVLKGRRVFLDYRVEPSGFSLERLSAEALDYLKRSGIRSELHRTPLERLRQLNPAAIELYANNGIELAAEPLEIAVSFQHNNGGLSGNLWWESPALSHFFPIGEANGSHGVRRPGGSALNAGQVGALRAAEYIGARYRAEENLEPLFEEALKADAPRWEKFSAQSDAGWEDERRELQERMSRVAAHIRDEELLREAIPAAWGQLERIERRGGRLQSLINLDLALTQAVYLEAMLYQSVSGVGSRGSAQLRREGKILPEDEAFRGRVLESRYLGGRQSEHRWRPVRPLPSGESWFESAWADFEAGKIYQKENGTV